MNPKLCLPETSSPRSSARRKRKLDGNLIQPLVRRPRLTSRNVALFRLRLIRYFPAQNISGLLTLIGVPDTDPEYPLEKALWSAFPALKAQRIKVYGWVNAGFDFSTSNKSNIPESYAIVPNKLELDQAVVRMNAFRTPCKGSTWTGDSSHTDVRHRLSLDDGARMV